QPRSKARLSLAKELEVEIPYLLDALDPVVRAVLVCDERRQPLRARLALRRAGEIEHRFRATHQTDTELCERLVHGLYVALGGRPRPLPKFLGREVAKRFRMARQVERLRANPGSEHRLSRARPAL